MLPVTRHKSFHVPHSLATCAAIVALITAIGWQSSGDDISTVDASIENETRVDAAQSQAQNEPDKPERSVRASASDCKRTCDGDSLSELLPLVLPRLPRP